MKRFDFPFTAIIGQEALKTALLLNAVDPKIGGVLIRGHKGAGKSTAARALDYLLPPIEVIDGCPYQCDPARPELAHDACLEMIECGNEIRTRTIPTPLVELPLSATEDRIVGTLNLESALQSGQRKYDPGLLAAANRGILYVDEVNLLPDHLVDLLLDVAASGVNIVEREGLRVTHPARFMLIGTMNPEEGDLRPQFLDRFGLCIGVETIKDTSKRTEIIRRRINFEKDPEGFVDHYSEDEKRLREQLTMGRRNLAKIKISDDILDSAVAIALAAEVQGHRTEITLVRAAAALCALLDKTTIGPEELAEAARLTLPHRVSRNPLEKPEDITRRIDEIIKNSLGLRIEPSEISGDEEIELMDNSLFPGSAAAGSLLFTYLKKKILSEPSSRMTASS